MLQAVQALYQDGHQALAAQRPAALVDAAYGPHARQRLDLYTPVDRATAAPVILWVHGGGFVRGEKSAPDHPFNAHAGRWAAQHGMVGAVMNYRLAPDHGWPAGGEDVGAAVDWLKTNAAAYGGDPDRVVLVGTSAGAVHVATHLQLRPDTHRVRGMVLLSGLYGVTPYSDPRDLAYYGSETGVHSRRAPLEALVATDMPLLVACSEFDPARFQAEFVGLLQLRLEKHGSLPRSYIGAGHNHYSFAYHLGSDDRRLADEILSFAGEVTAETRS